jgi:hypothetical protein
MPGGRWSAWLPSDSDHPHARGENLLFLPDQRQLAEVAAVQTKQLEGVEVRRLPAAQQGAEIGNRFQQARDHKTLNRT